MDRIKPKQATVQPLADGKDGGGLTGYTQLPYARRGRLRLRENRERGLGNGLNDKTKEGFTPIAVQKTMLIYTYGISCQSKKNMLSEKMSFEPSSKVMPLNEGPISETLSRAQNSMHHLKVANFESNRHRGKW